MQRLAAFVVLAACSKSPREKAQAIVDDTSLATPQAIEQAARIIYPDAATVTVEPGRLTVVIDRSEKPTIEQRGGEVTLTFHQALDGKFVDQDSAILAVGGGRGIREVLSADRYNVDVLGLQRVIISPRRTVVADQALQSFNTWPDADLAKVHFDLLMNDRTQPMTLKRP